MGTGYTALQGDKPMLSKDQFAEMNARLEETERREQALMQSLRDRLSAVDQKLLEDVRNIGLEHEGRRTMILTELQSLAERVGAFPAVRARTPNVEPLQQTGDAPSLANPTYVPQTAAPDPRIATQPIQAPAQKPAPARTQGDWRAAAERIRQDIESKLQSSNAQHTDPWAEDVVSPAQGM